MKLQEDSQLLLRCCLCLRFSCCRPTSAGLRRSSFSTVHRYPEGWCQWGSERLPGIPAQVAVGQGGGAGSGRCRSAFVAPTSSRNANQESRAQGRRHSGHGSTSRLGRRGHRGCSSVAVVNKTQLQTSSKFTGTAAICCDLETGIGIYYNSGCLETSQHPLQFIGGSWGGQFYFQTRNS